MLSTFYDTNLCQERFFLSFFSLRGDFKGGGEQHMLPFMSHCWDGPLRSYQMGPFDVPGDTTE